MRIPRLAFLLIFVMFTSSWGSATQLTVTTNADNGAGSLRDAVATANNGDTIVFDAALNGSTILYSTGEIDIFNNITILGPGVDQITLDGDTLSRLFEIDAGATVYMSGLTLTKGKGPQGGAIFCRGSLTLRDMKITYSKANGQGGAVYVQDGGSLNLFVVEMDSNYATGQGGALWSAENVVGDSLLITNNITDQSGGGIFMNDSAQLILDRSEVGHNTCQFDGGGIMGWVGTILRITDCYIHNNQTVNSTSLGGGVMVLSLAIIERSTLAYNQSGYGGGVAQLAGNFTQVLNSTISNNHCWFEGGACYFSSGVVAVISNTTMAYNYSDFNLSPTVYVVNMPSEVRNSIAINQESLPDFVTSGGSVLMLGGNVIGAGDGLVPTPNDTVGTALVPLDPDLTVLSNNGGYSPTHVPGCTSPAINYALNVQLPTVDQTGALRWVGSAADAGSVELQRLRPSLPDTLAGDSICMGSSPIALTIADTGDYIYDWYSLPTGGGLLALDTGSFTPPSAGTYYVEVVDTIIWCSSERSVIILSEMPLPPAPADSIFTACASDSGWTLSIPDNGFHYFWYDSLTGGSLIDSGTVISVADSGSWFVAVLDTTNGCISNPRGAISLTLTAPTATITTNGNTLIASSAALWQWYLDGVPVGNADTLQASVAGVYQVLITSIDGCQAWSDTLYFEPLGLQEWVVENKVYPNPADQFLLIDAERFPLVVTITDLNGKVVFENPRQGNRLDVSQLPEGFYFLRLEAAGKVQVHRIVIQR